MKIVIENLEFKAIIGVLEFERITPQRVVINLEIEYEFENGKYLDYAQVVESVKALVQNSRYLLLEEAIEGIFDLLRDKFPKIYSLECKISKPDIFKECIVSIQEARKF